MFNFLLGQIDLKFPNDSNEETFETVLSIDENGTNKIRWVEWTVNSHDDVCEQNGQITPEFIEPVIDDVSIELYSDLDGNTKYLSDNINLELVKFLKNLSYDWE